MEGELSHRALANGEPSSSSLQQILPSSRSSTTEHSLRSASSVRDKDVSPKTVRSFGNASAAQPWRLPIIAMFVHVVVIEPLPVYSFYISFISLLGELIAFLEFWYQDPNNLTIQDYQNMGQWLYCAKNDAYAACFTFNVHFPGQCLVDEFPNYLGYVNAGCVIICLSMGFCQSAYVAWNKEFDVCSGGYLACRWAFEGTIIYRVGAGLLLAYTLFTLIAAVYVTGTSLSTQLLGDMAEAFLIYQAASMVLLLVSAAVLASPSGRMPIFNYRQEDFRQLRFRRSWANLCFEDSSSLARRFERAILLAQLGRKGELEAMLVEPGMADEVLRMTALGEETENEESGSESAGPECGLQVEG